MDVKGKKAVVFGVGVGGGVGAWLTPRLFGGVDLRLTEGLSDAYAGSFTDARNRSLEARVYVGVPISVLRNR